jgi:hypothetical protein
LKTVTAVVLVVVAVLLTSAVFYAVTVYTPKSTPVKPTPTPTSTSTTSPTPASSTPPPPATLTADIVATAVSDAPDVSGSQVLVINGTVTNNSPNTAYNVGLHAFAGGSYEFPYFTPLPAINLTVPLASGTYGQNYANANTPITYALSTLAPYQSVSFNITIIPWASSQEPVLNGINVTTVWSNMP